MKSLPRRNGLQHSPAAHFTLAFILPSIAAALTVHFSGFNRAPYGLSLMAVCVVASMGGMAPSVFAVVVAGIGRFAFAALDGHPVPLSRLEVVRIAVILGAALIVSFITSGRRRAQAALEVAHDALQERTDALIESLHSSKCASWILDLDSLASAKWYSGSYQVFGIPFSEIEPLPSLLPLLHPEDRTRLPNLVQLMKSTAEPILWEFRAPWPNGEIHWLEMRATRVAAKHCIWRGLTFDITERKLAELALLRSEKLAAMGRLASTVAHEINNPLEAVTNLLYLARTDPDLGSDTRTYLATAETELARLSEITRLTLGFVRSSSVGRPVAAATIAEEVLSIFRHRLDNKGVQIVRTYQADATIHIAPHELRQIFTNLVSNAADAINHRDSRLGVEVKSLGGKVVAIVEDSGNGMSPDVLARVFEPFFTTKHDIGTGIGLWVTKELVENNGGRISAESGNLAPQVTTRFTVEFPAAAN